MSESSSDGAHEAALDSARGRGALAPLLSRLPVLPGLCLLITLACVINSAPQAQVTMAAIFACAAVASIAGFAFSALAGSLLVLLQPAAEAVSTVELLLVSSIAIQAFSVWSIRRTLGIDALGPYVIGGLLTLPLGVCLLFWLRADLFAPALGIFLIVYGSLALSQPRLTIGCNSLAARVVVGGLGGLTGAMAAFPGACITMWCLAQGMAKTRQRAIVQPYILIMQLAALALISLVKAGPSVDLDILRFVPPAILGAWIGLTVYERLNTRQFNRIVTLLLLVSGVILASRGL